MTDRTGQLADNLANWNERAELHVESYGAEALADDPAALSATVTTDAALMAPHLPDGQLAGLDLVHLQCHIGTDSISLARLGATVTGVDFSDAAVAAAAGLAARAGLADRVRFVTAAVEEAPAALAGQRFDVVYTSVGVLCWLPDLAAWGRAVARLLKPGGLFFVRDDHPMMTALEWDAEGRRFWVARPYFHSPEPTTWDNGVDYSSPVALSHRRCHGWAHPLSEVVGALLGAGLAIESFREHQRIGWAPSAAFVSVAGGAGVAEEYELYDRPERVPLTFSVAARLPADPR
ncbi:MAG: methyltransferase domain-containing protein [Propionibacteriaceae bacterium]|jgi:SAM-dependent methyltransferase|nr:methyltransferase domain-containing protein [Propionibacteriaceae bacterium]